MFGTMSTSVKNWLSFPPAGAPGAPGLLLTPSAFVQVKATGADRQSSQQTAAMRDSLRRERR